MGSVNVKEFLLQSCSWKNIMESSRLIEITTRFGDSHMLGPVHTKNDNNKDSHSANYISIHNNADNILFYYKCKLWFYMLTV